jgi:hypothetical protein
MLADEYPLLVPSLSTFHMITRTLILAKDYPQRRFRHCHRHFSRRRSPPTTLFSIAKLISCPLGLHFQLQFMIRMFHFALHPKACPEFISELHRAPSTSRQASPNARVQRPYLILHLCFQNTAAIFSMPRTCRGIVRRLFDSLGNLYLPGSYFVVQYTFIHVTNALRARFS